MRSNRQATVIRIFHRWSGIALIVFLALKMLSGYSMTGQMGVFVQEVGYRIHFSAWVDAPLLFLFTFHALYGILKILLSAGLKNKKGAFLIVNVMGAVLFVLSILFIYAKITW